MSNPKPVVRIDMETKRIEEFPTVGEAAAATYCNPYTVTRYCNGQRRGLAFGKYRFVWKERN